MHDRALQTVPDLDAIPAAELHLAGVVEELARCSAVALRQHDRARALTHLVQLARVATMGATTASLLLEHGHGHAGPSR